MRETASPPGPGSPGIFLSYRRADSAGYAGRLFDRLAERYGRSRVFMDVEAIGVGTDFVEAIDAAVAWSFSGYDSFQIHADYLFHNFTWTRDTDIKDVFPLYYGIGVRIKLGTTDNGRLSRRTDARVGIRIPGGLSYWLEEAPIEFFVEIVPLLDLVPATDLDLNGAVGARYYFR